MAELPKSVIAGMKAQGIPREHPDADLLAAFSEQALTGRERESVLAHLAVCAACRETVALAAPSAPAEETVRGFAPWYRRPQTFAWAGTLATVALVAALIVNYGQDRWSPKMTTDATPAKVAVTPAAQNQPAAPASENKKNGGSTGALSQDKTAHKSDLDQRRDKLTTAERQAGEERALTAAPRQVLSKDEKKLEGGSLQSQYSGMKEQPAPAPPPPPSAAATKANVMSEPQAVGGLTQKPKSSTATESVMVQAAPAERSQNAAAADAAVAGAFATRTAKVAVAPVFRWSISEKGKLQRSLDGGHTWQPVLTNEDAVFRSLAVIDNKIWAGGSAATLFYSADAGATWVKQSLPGASADITSLQFADAQHGSAHTSDGRVWSTSDGGQHWAKR